MSNEMSLAEFQAQVWRSTSETAFQTQVLDLANTFGWDLAYHTHDSRRSPSGFPDLVLVRLRDRRVLWAELKTEKGVATPQQVCWGEALLHCGAEYYCWRPSDRAEIERVLG